MADPFATADDVAARWRTLTSDEEELADVLAADASDMIRTRWPGVDTWIANSTLSADSVLRVVAGMVRRAMNVGDAAGLESRSDAAGPFSTALKFANPGGNLYFTADDLRLFEPSTYAVTARNGWLA